MRVHTKLMIAALSVVTAVLVGFGIHANAESVDRSRDCDTFAVIRCGTMSAAELRKEYDTLNTDRGNGSTTKQSDIPAIFSALGISRAALDGNYVSGAVYRDGTVKLDNGKVVAKNAQTAIRNVSGTAISGSSTAKIVSTSRMGSAQAALIRLNAKGQFVFAVMTPCGNPVKATNVVPEPPKPQPKDIQVCRLSDKKYPVTIKENQFDPKLYSKNPEDCKQKPAPIASCKVLNTPVVTNRTNVALVAEAAVANGASVSSYHFTIVDATGKVVQSKTVATTNTSANTAMTVNEPGRYTAKVTVKTSLGDKTAAVCQKPFEIKPELKPGVSIIKTVNQQEHIIVDVNQPFTYELTVTNTGNANLKDVKVTDKAPKGVSFQKADKGEIKDNAWSYTIPELKIAQSMKFTITATATESSAKPIVNQACVDAPSVPGTPDDCDEATIELKVKACNTETGVIETVKPGSENTAPHTTDLAKCDKVKVCDTTTKTIVTITRKEAEDTNRYASEDSEKCKPTPVIPPKPVVPETPKELPQTGIGDTISAGIGLGSLLMATTYYFISRRNLIG